MSRLHCSASPPLAQLPARSEMSTRQRGFNLVELMVALAIGAILSVGIIRIVVNNEQVMALNNALSTVTENSRIAGIQLSVLLRMAGRSDLVNSNIDNSVDLSEEAIFIKTRSVLVPGDVTQAGIGSVESGGNANDVLAFALQHNQDCSGNQHGFAGQDFLVINQIYVNNDNQLICAGYNGRASRTAAGSPINTTVLVRDVENFQVQYLLFDESTAVATSQYIEADQLAANRGTGKSIIGVRVGLLLSNGKYIRMTEAKTFTLINGNALTTDQQRFRDYLTLDIGLRNNNLNTGIM